MDNWRNLTKKFIYILKYLHYLYDFGSTLVYDPRRQLHVQS